MAKILISSVLFVLLFLFGGCASKSPTPPQMKDANTSNEKALVEAVVKEDFFHTKELIEKGTNPNLLHQARVRKYALIEIAVKRNDYNITKLLLDGGANVLYATDVEGILNIPVIAIASSKKDGKILKLLLPYIKANQVDNYNTFIGAVIKDNNDNLKLLLDDGFDVNAKNDSNKTILMTSASNNRFHKSTKILLEYGADVNATNYKGNNALHGALAVEKYNHQNIKYLLEYGIDVNHINKNGYSPLYYSLIFDNNIEVVKLLIKYGAKIDDKSLNTALLYKKYEIAKLLINDTTKQNVIYLYEKISYSNHKGFNFLLDNGFEFTKGLLDDDYISMIVVNNRYKELKEAISKYGLGHIHLQYIPSKAQNMIIKILDEIQDNNSLSQKQKISIANQLNNIDSYDRAYSWFQAIKGKDKHQRLSCFIGANAGKLDTRICHQAGMSATILTPKKKGDISFYYLLAQKYDLSIEYANDAIKDKQYFAYANKALALLLQNKRKEAYKAYKNYFETLHSIFTLYAVKKDFDLLIKNYPKKKDMFQKAYKYCKKIDKSIKY
jgi:ankyrin repeat protein